MAMSAMSHVWSQSDAQSVLRKSKQLLPKWTEHKLHWLLSGSHCSPVAVADCWLLTGGWFVFSGFRNGSGGIFGHSLCHSPSMQIWGSITLYMSCANPRVKGSPINKHPTTEKSINKHPTTEKSGERTKTQRYWKVTNTYWCLAGNEGMIHYNYNY